MFIKTFNAIAISKIGIKPEKCAGIELDGHERCTISGRTCCGYVYVP